MAEFFFNYGLFALKTLTLLALLGVFLSLLIGTVVRSSSQGESDHFEIVKLNDRLEREQELLGGALLDDTAYNVSQKEKKVRLKKERKARKKELAAAKKNSTVPPPATPPRKRVFALNFDGDIAASAVKGLRREISAILSLGDSPDEVVVCLESGGGMVHSYGLAASQLARIKSQGIKLTVCVDKVAASGGYMMACVADQILAAPFAVIGSIGVVAQMPNFNRLLKKNDIDFELLTAGEHKRTLTVFGENTPEGRKKFQEELDITHALFKEFVAEQRPVVQVAEVATGEVWLGKRALERHLVDGLKTSDEYLTELCREADVLELRFEKKKSLQDKIANSLSLAADRVLSRLWQRATERTPGA